MYLATDQINIINFRVLLRKAKHLSYSNKKKKRIGRKEETEELCTCQLGTFFKMFKAFHKDNQLEEILTKNAYVKNGKNEVIFYPTKTINTNSY